MTLENVKVEIKGNRAVLECDATPEVKALVGFEMWKPEQGGVYYMQSTSSYPCISKMHADTPALTEARVQAGNCFPTRELAETQAEIERITRKLNQAAVKYGGQCGATKHCYYAVTGSVAIYHPWGFPSNEAREDFMDDFIGDLTRLAELNASLTTQWQAVLNTQQAQR